MNRTIRAAFAALALTAIAATPAFAAKPAGRDKRGERQFLIPCGTVTLVEEWSQSVVLTTWLDGNGDATRAHARVRFDGTITAPGSTLRLSDVGRFTSFMDFGRRRRSARSASSTSSARRASAWSPTTSARSRSSRTGRSRPRDRTTCGTTASSR